MRTDGAIFGFAKGSLRLTLNWKLCEITLRIKHGVYRNEKVRNLHKNVCEIFMGLTKDLYTNCWIC